MAELPLKASAIETEVHYGWVSSTSHSFVWIGVNC